ncbi:hypothetical protein H9X96_18490 [Pedobacter sp. N36a]|uniref:hypothetical protein n=1 Tax=Pedobacter sp. N36a TaxID=2767996 RepID=UPI0016570ECC|nr:hypothetical protein [Pedobacter sp. N36a]MBC8987755.1 hypothetical protein [Pedobacter sp. N36a]
MKKKHNYSLPLISKAMLSPVNVGMLYSFMIKRIAKGYSTSEVSFLMGYANDYMKKKEELSSIGFSYEDMHCFQHAVEEPSLRGLISSFENGGSKSEYQLIKISNPVKIEFMMMRLETDGQETPIFHLIENNMNSIAHKITELSMEAQAMAILNVLFEGKLFYSPQSPLQIYQKCRNKLSESFSPRHLQAALLNLTKKNDFPKLKRVKSKDNGCVYEKVFE